MSVETNQLNPYQLALLILEARQFTIPTDQETNHVVQYVEEELGPNIWTELITQNRTKQ